MNVFNLPSQTIVNKVIPKNAFDAYTTSRQKKKLAEFVERIRWSNKLSPETLNLSGKDISEIEIFEIELRKKEEIADLLAVFDKAIPYPIIFFIFYRDQAYISASTKHLHPVQEDISIVDWTFKSDWLKIPDIKMSFDLKKNLDHVYQDFCNQLSSGLSRSKSMNELVAFEQEFFQLHNKIDKVKASLKRTVQFNRKVELNQELKQLEADLAKLKKAGRP